MNRFKIYLIIAVVTTIAFPSIAQEKPWSLRQCIDTAIARNITLKQGQLTSNVNKVNLKQAKDNLYPNLNITDAPSLNFGKTETTSGTYVAQNTTTNSFALVSDFTLFDGFQYQYSVKQSSYVYQAGVQNVEKMKNDLTLNILAGYLQLIASYAQVDIAVSQLSSDSILTDRMSKLVSAGILPELNLYQMQSQTAADKFSKVNAETQLTLAKVNLMQLMDVPVLADFNVERPEITDNSLAVTLVTSTDIDKNAEGFLPEIKGAELNFNASEMAINVAKSLYMPRLILSGAVRTSGSTLGYQSYYQPGTIGYLQGNPADPVIGLTGYSTTNNSYSNLWNQSSNYFNEAIGLTLSIPLFNSFQARNSTAIARINSQSAKLNEEAVKLQLRQTIELAYAQLLAAAAQYAAAKEALATEMLTYNNIEKKFEIGLTNATDYLVEKSNLLKANQTIIQTKYNYLFKSKLIDFYLGKPITM